MSTRSIRESARLFLVALTMTIFVFATTSSAQTTVSVVENREINSQKLIPNKIGTNPKRKLAIYLPAGYSGSAKRYPVIYFLQNPLDQFNVSFYQGTARALLDRTIAAGAIRPVILVAVDMATPFGCSWYVNSPVTGNWQDFMVQEVVPYVDANFRTIADRNSRGIGGQFMGGYGAIRFGMTHPEVFGAVYALHPVGTGSGVQTMYSRPDWDQLAHIQSLSEWKTEPFANIFLSIFQASVPNLDKPPLFVDLQAHKEGDKLVIDSQVTEKIRDNFLLETMIGKYADNLKSLRGFKMDWARNDLNPDHIYSNHAFTHKMNEFGIPHQSEEYNGAWEAGNWDDGGRISTELLPFFQQKLVFE